MTEISTYCPDYINVDAILPLEIAETYIPAEFTHQFDPRYPTPKELGAYILLNRFVPSEKSEDKINAAAYFMGRNFRVGLDNKEMNNVWTFIAAHVLHPHRDTPMNSLEAFIHYCARKKQPYDTFDTSLLSEEFLIKASKKYFYLRPDNLSFGLTEQQRLVGGF